MLTNSKAFGSLHILVTDAEGTVKYDTVVPNTVVNGGKAFIAQSLLKTTTNSPAAMTHMALGTGTTAVATTQAALVTETGTRVAVTPTNTTVTVTNDTAQYVATFAAGNATGGTMLCRTVFAVINKDVNDNMTITWRIQIT
jgi:hypothetical protein